MAELDRELLAKLCELLASDQDGEVMAAARKIAKMVRASKMRWVEILQPVRGTMGVHQQERDLRRSPEEYKRAQKAAEDELKRASQKHADNIYRVLVESVMMRAFTVSEEEREFIVAMNRKTSFDATEKKRINTIYNKAFDVRVKPKRESNV